MAVIFRNYNWLQSNRKNWCSSQGNQRTSDFPNLPKLQGETWSSCVQANLPVSVRSFWLPTEHSAWKFSILILNCKQCLLQAMPCGCHSVQVLIATFGCLSCAIVIHCPKVTWCQLDTMPVSVHCCCNAQRQTMLWLKYTGRAKPACLC